jgi:hypothetical protein
MRIYITNQDSKGRKLCESYFQGNEKHRGNIAVGENWSWNHLMDSNHTRDNKHRWVLSVHYATKHLSLEFFAKVC